jgi:hypothetical protein
VTDRPLVYLVIDVDGKPMHASLDRAEADAMAQEYAPAREVKAILLGRPDRAVTETDLRRALGEH